MSAAEAAAPPSSRAADLAARAAGRVGLDGVALRYALRVTAAVLLALLMAFTLNLDRPNWAVISAVFLVQDDLGLTVWKCLARLAGTVLGATVALTLLAWFAQEPVFLLAGLAAWLAACAFLARFEIGSDAYVCSVAGLTATVIAVDSSTAPLTSIEIAIARLSEVSIGVIAATTVSLVLFQRSAADALDATRLQARRNLLRLAGAAARDDALAAGDHRAISALTATIGGQIRAVEIEQAVTPARAAAYRWLAVEQPLAFAEIELLDLRNRRLGAGRGEALRAEADDFERLLTMVADAALPAAALEAAARCEAFAGTALRSAADGLEEVGVALPEAEIERRLARYRLARLAATMAGAFRADAAIREPGRPMTAPPRLPRRYGDPLDAAADAFRVAVAFTLAAWFWLASAWPGGQLVTLLTGSMVLSFQVLLPRVALTRIGRGFALGTLLAVLPLLAVLAALPRLEGFPGFATVVGTFLIVFFLAGAPPARRVLALAAAILFAFGLGPSNEQQIDPLNLVNTTAGVACAALVLDLAFSTILPDSPRRVRFLLASGTRRLVRQAVAGRRQPVAAYFSRAFDLLADRGSRLDPNDPAGRAMLEWARRAVLTGGEALQLRWLAASSDLPEALRPVLERARTRVGEALDDGTPDPDRGGAGAPAGDDPWLADARLAAREIADRFGTRPPAALDQLPLLLLFLRDAVRGRWLLPPSGQAGR